MTDHLYLETLQLHYETYFGLAGKLCQLNAGPTWKLHSDFHVLEIPPNSRHSFWAYCTLGMSLGRTDEALIELVVYSPYQDESQVELLTVCASYHRNGLPLDLHHTVNFGRPWQINSLLDHGFISLPYLDGPQLEVFKSNEQPVHCYWLIPITQHERDYKIANGCEALEQLFEDNQFDYLNSQRGDLTTGTTAPV